jgi:hypothetical protein
MDSFRVDSVRIKTTREKAFRPKRLQKEQLTLIQVSRQRPIPKEIRHQSATRVLR